MDTQKNRLNETLFEYPKKIVKLMDKIFTLLRSTIFNWTFDLLILFFAISSLFIAAPIVCVGPGLGVLKLFFMLKITEHKMIMLTNVKNANNLWHFNTY